MASWLLNTPNGTISPHTNTCSIEEITATCISAFSGIEFLNPWIFESLKRSNTVSIAQVINEVIGEYKIGDKLKESRIVAAWSQVLGPLAKPTDQLYVKNKTLFAILSSSVIRNELSMMRSTLVRSLNEKVGEEVITDIVFRWFDQKHQQRKIILIR